MLDKIKTVFGKSKSIDKTVDGNYIQDIIDSVENAPFAASQSNVLYGGINELAGYHYFQTVIIGTLKLKTHQGAKLTIIGADFKLQLNSDMLELESEASNVPNQFVTKIDFEIDQADLSKIERSKIEKLHLSSKKENLEFSMVEIINEEEE